MSSRKTYDTDIITLRRIFAVTPGTNTPIPSGNILATMTHGEASYVDPLSVPAIGAIGPSTLSAVITVISTNSAQNLSTLIYQYIPSSVSTSVAGLAGVTQILAGANILLNPTSGTGIVRITATGSGGGITSDNLASTVIGLGTAGYLSSATGGISVIPGGLVSTANLTNLVSTSYFTSQLASTIIGLGTAGYISSAGITTLPPDLVSTANLSRLVSTSYFTSQLASTIIGLGTAGYISSAGITTLPPNLVSTANLTGLISTANLINLVSTSYLATQFGSTIVGLGTAGYVSSINGTITGNTLAIIDSANQTKNNLTVTNGIFAFNGTPVGSGTVYYTYNTSTYQYNISSVSTLSIVNGSTNIVNVQYQILSPEYFSTIFFSTANVGTSSITFVDTATSVKNLLAVTNGNLQLNTTNIVNINNITSTVIGLGTAGYLSSVTSAALPSGLISTANLIGHVSTANLTNLISTSYLATQLGSTIIGLGTAGYLSSAISATLPSGLISTANLIGHVSTANLTNLISTSYLATQLGSTIIGLGTAGYLSSATAAVIPGGLISTANLTNLVSTTYFARQLGSTVIGLGTAGYLSSATASVIPGGLISTANLTNLVSTSYLATQLGSTLIGLGTAGYLSSATAAVIPGGLISTANLTKLVSTSYLATQLGSTVIGLGTAGYLSSATATFLPEGLISTANLINLVSTSYFATQLGSTLIGLGTAGYLSAATAAILPEGLISTANLIDLVSTANLTNLVSTSYLATQLGSTVVGLGTAGVLTNSNTNIYIDSYSIGIALGSNSSGGSTYTIQTTKDGLHWTPIRSGGFNISGTGAYFNGSYWISVGIDSRTLYTIQQSTDGLTWTPITSGGFNQGASSIIWNGSYWIATGYTTSGPTYTIQQSTDGLNWSPITSGGFSFSGQYNAINASWNGSYWLAAGQDSRGALYNIQTSTDGLTWTPITSGGFNIIALDIAWNGSYWIAVGIDTRGSTYSIQKSTNGLDWVPIDSGGFNGQNFCGVGWNGSYWVATGTDSRGSTYTIQRSTDGLTWTPITSGGFQSDGGYNGFGISVLWNGSYWVVTGNSDTRGALYNIQTSTDGLTWTPIISGGFDIFANGYGFTLKPNLGINSNAPQYTLDVNGDIHTSGFISSIGNICTYGNINAARNINAAGAISSIGNIQANGNIITSARIGVNCNTPSYALDINGSAYINNDLNINGTVNAITQINLGGLQFAVPGSAGFNIAPTGEYVGINVNNPTYALDVTGDINVSGTGYYVNGGLVASDRRIKTDITYANLELCYSTLRDTPLHHFGFVSSFAQAKQDKHQLGFIADELSTIFPKSVFLNKTSMEGFSTIYYVNFEQIQLAHFGATKYMASLLDQQNSTIVGQNAFIDQQISTNQGQAIQFINLQSQFDSFSTILQNLSR